MNTTTDVKQRILESAQHLIQLNGYHAFSYRDIAAVVGVKTSSIHYHFQTKGDLAAAVIDNHLLLLQAELDAIQVKNKRHYLKRLDKFLDLLFQSTYLNEKKMCVGGMLAIDVLTLPNFVQKKISNFF